METGVESRAEAGEHDFSTAPAEAGRLEIGLLGEISVRRNGKILPLPQSRKCRALIAYLIVSGRPQRRERLCELFWEVPDDPKGSLRWSLSKIRRVLGDALIADRDNVRIESAALTVDAADLLAIAKKMKGAQTAELERLASGCGEEFGVGIDLPRCPDFQSWLAAVREDIRQAQVALYSELVRRLSDEPDRALPFARKRAECEPISEQARIDLVTLLAAGGRAEEAERQRALAAHALANAGIAVPAALSRPVGAPEVVPPPPARPSFQRVQYCTTPDGTKIAYSLTGSGPPLVKTANWLSHLEFEWESPLLRPWLTELSRGRTLVRYDERGNGLSSRRPADLSQEALVQDLETVTSILPDAPFDLMGISQGAAVAIAFAVKRPERVRRLVIFGGFPMGWARADNAEIYDQWEAMVTLTRTGWGTDNPAFRQMFTSLFVPRATPEQASWFNELQRVSASPEEAQRLQRAIGDLDVRGILHAVHAPTIVFHSRSDAMVPFGNARFLAANIPGAELVGLESDNHLLLEDEPAWAVFKQHLRDFLDP